MISKKLHEKISGAVKHLQRFIDRWWYAPVMGALAGSDNFIVVVPTDGILVSSSMLNPRRWLLYSLATAIGSTAGAVLLSYLVEMHGLPWILDMYPGIDQTAAWAWTDQFFSRYGMYLVFFVAASPLMQQPTVILASLAGENIATLGLVIFVGRTLKFLFIGYLGSHAPKLLNRLWGMKDEMADAGVKLP